MKTRQKSFYIYTWVQPSCEDPLTLREGNPTTGSFPGETSSYFLVQMARSIKSTWKEQHLLLPTWPLAENSVRLNLATQSVIHKPKGRAVKNIGLDSAPY